MNLLSKQKVEEKNLLPLKKKKNPWRIYTENALLLLKVIYTVYFSKGDFFKKAQYFLSLSSFLLLAPWLSTSHCNIF